MYIIKLYKFTFKIVVITLVFSHNVFSETLIVNIESKHNNGLALIGIYDKEENFGLINI